MTPDPVQPRRHDAPPLPDLTGLAPGPAQTGEQRRRDFAALVVSGKPVPPAPEGESAAHFILGFGDVVALQKYDLRRHRIFYAIFMGVSGLILIALLGRLSYTTLRLWALLLSAPPMPGAVKIALAAATLGFTLLPIFLAGYIAFTFFMAGRVFERRYGSTPFTVSINPERILLRTGKKDLATTWRKVRVIDLTAHHIFLRSPLRLNPYSIIPRWAFPTDADAESFFAEMRGYWEAARKTPRAS